MASVDLDLGRYQLGWSDEEDYVFKPKKGLNEEIVREMSAMKHEPEWMRDFRLKALTRFEKKPMAQWFAVNMPDLDFDDIYYYIKPTGGQVKDWEELPESIKRTYERLGIPEAERKYLAGVTAQYECLRGSTRVWTSRGMVPIKEIGPGDRVFALDRRTRTLEVATVVAGGQSGEKEIFEITARGRTIGASGNHPFLVLRGGRRPGARTARDVATWVAAEDLAVGDLVAIATDVPEYGVPAPMLVDGVDLVDSADGAGTAAGVTLPRTSSDDLCWFLGVYLGNGYLHHRGRHVSVEIAVDRTDERLVAEIRRVAHELFGLDLQPSGDGDLLLGGPTAAALGRYLELNGFAGSSLATRLPDWVYGLPRSQRLSLLRGLLGPDGGIRDHPSSKDATHCSAGAQLLSDVEELSALSGGSDRIPAVPGHPALTGEMLGMLGFTEVERIERAGVEPVYDIEVAGHHNFVAEGFVVHNSEVVFHRNREDLEAQGVLFCDMDTAVREYPDVVRKWFGTVIPPNDNKFAALNSAVWSGGSFIYVPPGVKVDMPLQAYFRINAENMGQFERTLIIADEGSQVHYVEGCSAPVYTSDSLHSAVVELIALPGSRITYTTIQNWSNNVYNLVTKRARAEAESHVEWIDGNIGCLAQGSRVTTPAGTKPIELVSPGDRVLAFDEGTGELCFRTVTAKRFSGYQPVREVRVGARSLRVTDNHPFYSYGHDPDHSYRHDPERAEESGRYRPAYVRADELTHAIVPVTSVDYGHPHKLERSEIEETTGDLMWLFGLFVGAGSIEREPAQNRGRRSARVTFSTPGDDRARPRLLEVVRQLLPGVAHEEGRDGMSVRWASVELAELFELNGFATGAVRKRVPGWALDLPEDQRLAFVAGFLDSGGRAPEERRGFSIESESRALLQEVAQVLTSLGVPCRIHDEEDADGPIGIVGHEPRRSGSHRLDLRADVRLVGMVSEPLRAGAARRPAPSDERFRRVGRSAVALPRSVEVRPVEVNEGAVLAPTWDIEVEGTGNFVSEGFIVHNSRLTMKYPSVYLVGPKASGEVLSVAYAGPGQHQDAGAKMIHAAPETTSTIVSKSISKDGGVTTYRGLVHVDPDAKASKSFVRCDALLLDDESVSETKPYMEVGEQDAQIGHEATVSKVGDDQLFYLMSRGLTESQAMGMIVNGFIEPVTRTLPMEYAVEWSRLIELQMEGSVG